MVHAFYTSTNVKLRKCAHDASSARPAKRQSAEPWRESLYTATLLVAHIPSRSIRDAAPQAAAFYLLLRVPLLCPAHVFLGASSLCDHQLLRRLCLHHRRVLC